MIPPMSMLDNPMFSDDAAHEAMSMLDNPMFSDDAAHEYAR